MKKVWTDSQGTIQSPSPGSRRSCFSRPVRLVALVFARSAASASTVLRVSFRTLTFNFQDYNTSAGEEFCRRAAFGHWSPLGISRRRPAARPDRQASSMYSLDLDFEVRVNKRFPESAFRINDDYTLRLAARSVLR